MICQNCGNADADGNYCYQCGEKLVTTCLQCGYERAYGKYCSMCGALLQSEEVVRQKQEITLHQAKEMAPIAPDKPMQFKGVAGQTIQWTKDGFLTLGYSNSMGSMTDAEGKPLGQPAETGLSFDLREITKILYYPSPQIDNPGYFAIASYEKPADEFKTGLLSPRKKYPTTCHTPTNALCLIECLNVPQNADFIRALDAALSQSPLYEGLLTAAMIAQINQAAENNLGPSEPVVRCPKCGSTHLSANKKGFSAGKALTGAVLTGGIGLLAGGIGSGKVTITCLNCGHQWRAGEE